MTESDLSNLIDQQDDFVSLSDLTARIVELTTKLSAPVQKVAQLISSDDRLLSQLMAVANAPFNGFSDPIPNIEKAVSLIGYRKICSLAASITLLHQFHSQESGEYDMRRHWEMALHTAVIGAELASRARGEHQVEAFAVGLLEDLGTLLFTRCLPISYGKALGLSEARDLHLSEAENELLDLNHTHAGALLCYRWKLHPTIVDAVRHHHFPETGETGEITERPLVRLISLANTATDIFFSSHPDDSRELLYDRGEQFFGFGSSLLDNVLEKVPDHVRKLAPPMEVTLTESGEAEDAAVDSLDTCPNCGTEATGSGKFCSECGFSLSKAGQVGGLSTNKILIAEDSAATRLALSILIRKLGYEPVEAYNGVDAVRAAQNERPGLVLMDINMPGMNGLEALRRIRKTSQIDHLPVVMLTSVTGADTVVQALEAGANDYVVKPFSANVIQDRIDKYMTKE